MKRLKRQSQETKDNLVKASNALFDPLKPKKADHGNDRLSKKI